MFLIAILLPAHLAFNFIKRHSVIRLCTRDNATRIASTTFKAMPKPCSSVADFLSRITVLSSVRAGRRSVMKIKSLSNLNFLRSVRKAALKIWNRQRCVEKIAKSILGNELPIFVVVTPAIVHLAAACLNTIPKSFNTFVILNGVDASDEAWLHEVHPRLHYIRLRTSLTSSRHNLIPHGEIIDCVAAASMREFCLMDADNFVLDADLLKDIRLAVSDEFAVGPYIKGYDRYNNVIPETFLIVINGEIFSELRSRIGLTAEVSKGPGRGTLGKALRQAGFAENEFPEIANDFWDTLQMFWCISQHHGFHFRHIVDGDCRAVHIGGTSYLYKIGGDVTRWNYLALSVHYLNLRLLELKGMGRFQERFRHLKTHYGTAELLLKKYPEFIDSKRFHDVEKAMNTCFDMFDR